MSKKRRWLLSSMALAAIIILVANEFALSYMGDTSQLGFWMTRISKFLVYGIELLIVYIFGKYLTDILVTEGNLKTVPKGIKFSECLLFIGVIVLLLSQSFGIYYYYDENNIYHRMPGYILAFVFPIVALTSLLFVICDYRKCLRKRLFFPLLLFSLFPLLAGVGQYFIHGVYPTAFSIVSMVALLYCFTIQDTNEAIEAAHQKELDLLLEKQENFNLMINQTTSALVEAIDAKDSYTKGHSRRVAEYSVSIAKQAGKTPEECETIYLTALLHDIGKIGIPDAIINKNGRLTDEEYETIKSHPIVGRDILSKIKVSPKLVIGASYHHERWDGKGYPFGLKGEKIPEIARIIAVADTYDAMSSKRSYRDVLPKEVIRAEFVKGSGTQFDPRFAEIMIDLIDSDTEYSMRE